MFLLMPNPIIWFTMSRLTNRDARLSLRHGTWGIHCSVSLPLSVFIYDTSSMTENTPWPWGQSEPTIPQWQPLPKPDLPAFCGSLMDQKTIATLPITLQESDGVKFGWIKAITSLHTTLEHMGWMMVMSGCKKESRRFNALSVTVSVDGIIWQNPLGNNVTCLFLLLKQTIWRVEKGN